MMSLWDALRMNMMISYQELVRTFPNKDEYLQQDATGGGKMTCFAIKMQKPRAGEAFIQEEWSCIR